MMWDSNRILTLLLVLWLHGASGTTGLSDREMPHPWLLENRSAKLLKLVCKPPAESAEWEKIYDLKLFAFLPQKSFSMNTTLAHITSAAQHPRRGKSIPDIADVIFSGDWDKKSPPSLTLLMPITRTDLGTYYCAGEYGSRDSINDKLSKFTTKFPVNDSFVASQGQGSQPSIMDNFEASVINVHKIKVTWRPPSSQGVIWSEESQFIEASVSRTIVDKDGREMIAPQSLFTTSGSGSFVYDSGVVLWKFQRATPVINNYSITLYVESQLCLPHCRYSCNVPYKDCVGKDAQFCVCSHQDSLDLTTESSSLSLNYFYTQQTSTPSFLHTDSSFTPTPSCEDCSLWKYLFISATCLLVVFVVVIIVLALCFWKYCKSARSKENRNEMDRELKESDEKGGNNRPPQDENERLLDSQEQKEDRKPKPPNLRNAQETVRQKDTPQIEVNPPQSTPENKIDDCGGETNDVNTKDIHQADDEQTDLLSTQPESEDDYVDNLSAGGLAVSFQKNQKVPSVSFNQHKGEPSRAGQ